ncbi:heat shock protein Hsp70 [Marinomonas sp. S3726]|uniref:Hsp70 family protein n=1 Tax=Marinomonas sp. S3726 TaxID=579484 RepID=UPI0005FA4071|nr:Hsp70 family protein [Marinomonas sp. S3726]KJZ13958.1 heat shock protein Hsp70 [Marinomonas sp. S3726]
MSNTQYFVGIDLGTTHSAIYYAKAGSEESVLTQLQIPQLVAPGQVADRDLLPSFIYQAHANEMLASDMQLPWGKSEFVVGELARDMGAKSSGRLIQSAKSWLCHNTVSSQEAILPIDAIDEVEKFSPAKVTQILIEHLVSTWNHTFPEALLSEQDVVITVPASFDPAARASTESAAQASGINARLIEEPLAAFYAWLSSAGKWQDKIQLDDQILVVDVGGGTTDLSLIQAVDNEGEMRLDRVAVGRHILLGGDNMDMAITYVAAGQIAATGTNLEAWQISALTQAARQAKERLLSNQELAEVELVVPSRGKSLFANKVQTSIKRETALASLIEGFFPIVNYGEQAQSTARSGIAKLNLEYEADPAISRHISEFLAKHQAKPNKVLLNGGVFKADIIKQRVEALLNNLLADKVQNIEILTSNDANYLDNAVAKGACYYALVQADGGIKVKSGLAANYYIGVESPMPAIPGMAPPVDAVCIAPFGLDEGSDEQMLSSEFALVVGQSVDFRFFQSKTADVAELGETVNAFSLMSLNELGKIQARLDAGHYQEGDMVRVILSSRITELGVLLLEAHDTQSDLSWTLEYQVRDA